MEKSWLRVILAVLASVCVGSLLGVGGYTFVAAHGAAYLSDDPRACVNCHIMREQFDAWQHGSHHAVATCNDCHLPHQNLGSKLLVKAGNGYHHSRAFTLQDFTEPIRIKPGNAGVLEANCLRCHGPMTDEITAHGTLGVPTDPTRKADLYGCVQCHQEVGHGSSR